MADVIEIAVPVTDGPGDPGTVLNSASPTAKVQLTNLHQSAVLEYKANAGDWQRLDGGCAVNLPLNLAVDVIRVRRMNVGTVVNVLAAAEKIQALPNGVAPVVFADGRVSLARADGSELTLAARQKITICGDSQVKNSVIQGYSIAVAAANAPGFSDISNFFFTRNFPQGNATFEFDYPNKRARVAAQGETFGPWVSIARGGVLDFYSSGGASARLYARASSYGNTLTTVTVAVAGNPWHTYGSGNVAGVLDALTGHRLEIVQPLLGVPGDAQMDVALRMPDILAQGAQVILCICGTNSLFRVGITPEEAVELERQNYLRAYAAGRIWISTTILPRWGTDGIPAEVNGYTVDKAVKLSRYNSLLYEAASKEPNWFVVHGDAAADLSNSGRAKVGTTSDGIHLKAGMSVPLIRQVVQIIDSIWPPTRTAPKLGSVTQTYDPLNNRRGNLINAGVGSFIGSGGTAQTGISVATVWAAGATYVAEDVYIFGGRAYRVVVGGNAGATGPLHTSGVATDGAVQSQFICAGAIAIATLPAGWTFTRVGGTAAMGKAFKYVDAEGEGLAMFVTSTAAAVEVIRGYTTSLTKENFSLGDVIDEGCDFDVQGVGCNGVAVTMIPDGSMLTSTDIKATQLIDVTGGFTGKATPCIPPGLVWNPAGVTSIPVRIETHPQPNAAYLWKMSNAFVRKVLPPGA